MPTIARIRDGNTVREHKNKYGPGITPRYLESGEVGAIEFDSTLFTETQASEWLTGHDYTAHSLEPEGKEPATPDKHRFLSIELSPSSDIRDVDGGLLVPGVKLLAPGTWTDSTQKTPCRYTDQVLERYSGNWIDKSYWSRHSGGTPRDITDRIADIRNVRYEGGVTADLFFHGATSRSLDAISLIRAAALGKVPWPYSSVEMFTRDKWIISEKLYEAQEILFDGAAMVNQGACRTCKIRNNAGAWIEVAEQTEPETTPKKQEQIMTDTKELETQVADLKKELADLKAKPATVKAEIPKELSDLIASQGTTIKELSARLEKIEKAPADPKTTPVDPKKELENLPELFVPVNKKSGTVGGN